MSRVVHVRPEAEWELVEAFWWYERQRSGLGREFLFAFDATVERVRRHPDWR